MSTNLEYRAEERQRKRESRRQANEAQREKGRQGWRSKARDKKQGYIKKCAARAKLLFLLIRPIVVFQYSPALP